MHLQSAGVRDFAGDISRSPRGDSRETRPTPPKTRRISLCTARLPPNFPFLRRRYWAALLTAGR